MEGDKRLMQSKHVNATVYNPGFSRSHCPEDTAKPRSRRAQAVIEVIVIGASLVVQMVKNLPARDVGSIPGLGRSPGEGNSSPYQYSCLENSMDRGAR